MKISFNLQLYEYQNLVSILQKHAKYTCVTAAVSGTEYSGE